MSRTCDISWVELGKKLYVVLRHWPIFVPKSCCSLKNIRFLHETRLGFFTFLPKIMVFSKKKSSPKTGVGNLRPAGRIRPTCACRNYKYSLCEYRFPLKILIKINESLAKINTAVFYVLSAPEYNHHNFDRKKQKWRRNRSEDLFF